MNWTKVSDKLPCEYLSVLGYDAIRGFTICKWLDRPDCPRGTYWIVNGSSGGIGTSIEVKPPEYWMPLPNRPY